MSSLTHFVVRFTDGSAKAYAKRLDPDVTPAQWASTRPYVRTVAGVDVTPVSVTHVAPAPAPAPVAAPVAAPAPAPAPAPATDRRSNGHRLTCTCAVCQRAYRVQPAQAPAPAPAPVAAPAPAPAPAHTRRTYTPAQEAAYAAAYAAAIAEGKGHVRASIRASHARMAA